METTENLVLPYILPAQAQKHVTHNEALRMLDAVVHLAVESRSLGNPPVAPVEGERHIVADEAFGEWAGKSARVAAFQDGGWAFFAPNEGWIAWVKDEGAAFVFNETGWAQLSRADSVAALGVNTAADATNRLAVKADAVLFSHDDVTPGTGGVQLKLNKASAADTASVLYQTGWSGRAEFGLAGDDDFHLKISADGAAWREALVVDRATGEVSLPATPPIANSFNLLKDAGRFAGSPEPQGVAAPSFSAPAYVQPTNGASISAGPKYIYNNTTYGGSAGDLDADVDALISKLKDESYRRYGVEFFVMQITAGSGTGTARVINGVSHYLPFATPQLPLPRELTINCHVLVKSGSLGCAIPSDPNWLYLDGQRYTEAQQILPADGWRQVTRRIAFDPRRFLGYNNLVHQIFATPGTVFYLAALTVTPGLLPIGAGRYYGVVPSLEAWR